ncbi:MAG: hypothetical protein WC813_01665 [Patescibacteria group bacterium]|jgi:hypothetical protein
MDEVRIGPGVKVRTLTRQVLERGPVTGMFRPYTRGADDVTTHAAEPNRRALSGFMFSVQGQTEEHMLHYEHKLVEDYCRSNNVEFSGYARLSLDGDVLVLQPLSRHGEPASPPHRIPFVPKMDSAKEPARQMFLIETPSDEAPEPKKK